MQVVCLRVRGGFRGEVCRPYLLGDWPHLKICPSVLLSVSRGACSGLTLGSGHFLSLACCSCLVPAMAIPLPTSAAFSTSQSCGQELRVLRGGPREVGNLSRGILLPVGPAINFSFPLEDADEPAFLLSQRLKGFRFWQHFPTIFI